LICFRPASSVLPEPCSIITESASEPNFDPKALGGDRRSGRIEAHGELILSLVEDKPDITLAELRACLAGKGIGVAISTLWRFFKRRGMTRKKRLHMLPSRTARTS
jgi:transposase